MSEQPQEQVLDADAARVIDYLQQHPGFFGQHPEVLAALDIPHDSGGAISLVQRQIVALRGLADKYRHQLEDLIEVARENERLSTRLHRLILALIEAGSQDEILATLRDQLREQFQTDAVELKLFSASELKQQAELGEAGPALFQDFMTRRRPSCGTLTQTPLWIPQSLMLAGAACFLLQLLGITIQSYFAIQTGEEVL